MKDLTWEYIVENCKRHIQHLQESIAQQSGRNCETQKGYLKSANGLKAAVPKLRAHAELAKIPPMMSLLALRWLLDNDLEVHLFYAPNKEKYEVRVVKWNESFSLIKEAEVGLNEATETIWEFITKVRNKEIW